VTTRPFEASSPATRLGVKICGLTRYEDAAWAAQCGATHLGVILAGGPRLVTASQAKTVLDPHPSSVRRVAVFGNQAREQIARLAETLALDVIQLHGGSTAGDVAWLRAATGCRIWPVVRVGADGLPDAVDELSSAAGALVVDTLVPGQLGGTGVPLAWEALMAPLAALRERVAGLEVVVAGGLTPGNVARAAHLLVPACVDVSSGVEFAPGVKDPARVRAFVRAVAGVPEI
jgi:phosphoribosylanthranilate isomerase